MKIRKFFSRLWHRALNPSVMQAVVAVIVGCAFIAAAVVLAASGENSAWSVICYVPAFLSLAYIVYVVCYGAPRVKRRTLEFAQRYDFTRNLVKNYGYRTVVLSCASLALNAVYAIYNGAVALHYLSLWSALFALYYVLLCALRGWLLMGKRSKKGTELSLESLRAYNIKLYVRCGLSLIAFTLLIVAALVRIVVSSGAPAFPHHLIYASALYTFVRLGFAVYNISKARKQNDFGARALRNVNFADALVALFVLQTSMNAAFGGGESFSRSMAAAFGTLVCAAIVVMGIYMIVSGRHALKTED